MPDIIDHETQAIIEAECASAPDPKAALAEAHRELLASLIEEPAGPLYQRPFGGHDRPKSGPVRE